LLFQLKSDTKIKEAAAVICENYSLSKPSLENEILTLKNIQLKRVNNVNLGCLHPVARDIV
jgi:hypothetical protein